MNGTFVYALREVGSTEPRYIGVTDYPNFRLVEHHRSAKYGVAKPEFAAWLSEHEIELVALAEYPTRKEALAAERAITRSMASLGFRLFNIINNVAHPAKTVEPLIATRKPELAA